MPLVTSSSDISASFQTKTSSICFSKSEFWGDFAMIFFFKVALEKFPFSGAFLQVLTETREINAKRKV